MGNQIKAIAQGHYNELLNKEEELSKKRMQICEKCPLFLNTMFGMICDSKRYLNPKTNEISYVPKEGFTKGCSCRVNQKTRVIDAKCPQGKW